MIKRSNGVRYRNNSIAAVEAVFIALVMARQAIL
jgi:hypothetical protein